MNKKEITEIGEDVLNITDVSLERRHYTYDELLSRYKKHLIEKVEELAGDPPTESNDTRRGYHQAIGDFIRLIESKE